MIDRKKERNHFDVQWDQDIPIPRLNREKLYTLVCLLTVLCYGHVYNGAFVFDDAEAILNNKDVTPSSHLVSLFYHDFWGNNVSSNNSHKSYRPLTVFTFRWNYWAADGYYPTVFHVTNVILHCVNSILVFHLYTLLIRGIQHSGVYTSDKSGLTAATLSTLIFTTHPLHVESVAGIVGRADLLSGFSFILSLICYIHAVNLKSEGSNLLLASLGLCIISTLCKEQGITVLGVCSVYDLVVNRLDSYLLSILGGKKCLRISKVSTAKFKAIFYRHIALFVTGVIILVFRWKIMGSSAPRFQYVDNPHSFIDNIFLRVLNYSYLYSLNAWLLLNPWWLCFDWSMGCVPIISSVFDVRAVLVLLFWSLLGLLVYIAFSRKDLSARLLRISLSLCVIPFLPASNVFFRVGFVVAERVLYIPSIGFCLFISIGVRELSCRLTEHHSKILQCFVLGLIAVFCIRSHHRSSDWKNENLLFISGATVCPLNAKVHYNIGKLYSDSGKNELAEKSYREALRLHPEYDQAMNNLANLLKDVKKSLLEAESLLQKAVKIRPSFAAAWMNLGIVQSDLSKHSLAEQSYLNALNHRKNYPVCYYNLGNLYLDMKRHQDALIAWQNATKLDPSNLNSWTNILILLDELGRLDDVIHVGKEALTHIPNESQIYFNIASSLGKANHYKESEWYFLQAIKFNGAMANYQANLGVLYHRWGKYKEAEESYKAALKLDPTYTSAIDNLHLLQKKYNT